MGNGCCQSRDLSEFKTNFTLSDQKYIKEYYKENGQGHVFCFFDKMEFMDQQQLLRDASQIDIELMNSLYSEFIPPFDASLHVT